MKDLRQNIFSGASWNFLQQIVNYLVQFVFGIILARLITPKEFGLVGIVGIFLGILPIFINGGFGSALLQRKSNTDSDYSTVFYFNFSLGILSYLILYLSAGFIADFFDNNDLVLLTRVLGINLVISSLGSIHNVILSKRLDFKTIAKLSVTSQLVSGIIAIVAAFMGFGIWALAIRTLVFTSLKTVLLILSSKWKPLKVFDFEALKNLFSFGSKLFIGGIISILFKNIYSLVIGKFYSPAQLGFYTKADQFSKLPAQNITAAFQRVAFPAFAQIQDDKVRLISANRKIMKTLMFLSGVSMFWLAASSESFIITLIGENWRQSVIYLQILSFVVFLYPAHSVNVNLLNVIGRSDLTLKLAVYKNLLLIPVILMGVYISIEAMLISMVIYSFLVLWINAYYTGRLLNYTFIMQIKDILPSILIALIMGSIVFIIPKILQFNSQFYILILQMLLGFISTLLIVELIKFKPYFELKDIIKSKFSNQI